MEGKVGGLASQALAFTNSIYVHPDDFRALVSRTPRGVTSVEQLKASGLNVWANNKYVFAAQPLAETPMGTVGMGQMHRLSANLAMGQSVALTPWVPDVARGFAIATVHFEVQALLMRSNIVADFDCEAVKRIFEQQYLNQAFSPGQCIVIDIGGKPVKMCVTKVDLLTPPDAPPAPTSLAPTVGLYVAGSALVFSKGKDAPFKLLNQSASGGGNRIFKPDFDFSKLGIGGLDKEFNDIFRRAFASRVFPASVIEKLGIKHVRGMLLFGPPGCGKTLIARQIGKVLNAKEPKVVNGPEILDKFVGESERKIRDLFADARKEQDEVGEDSELHIIIFDEIDAICKARGSSRDGTGVGDSVVNQLLTQIDGVDSLNNVLVIGMTNRKDMLDEALMRPGRLEVQVEINLPDEHGRGQILSIHTSKARANGILHPALLADLDACMLPPVKDAPLNLAQRTKNFSGAEIEGLVRAATAHALSRGTDGKTYHAIQNFTPEISLADFELALSEVKPKFGAPQDTLEMFFRNGLLSYGPAFDDVQATLRKVLHHVKTNEKTSLMSVLLHGQPGSGKTALAAASAVASEYPLVRLVKVADLIGRQELAKSSYLYTLFEEAYRSPLSLIIIDDMERLMEYVASGPRFSNSMLQTLLVMIKNPVPVPGRKLVVVGITSAYDEMASLGLASVFDVSVLVPQLEAPDQFDAVLAGAGLPMSASTRSQIALYLSQTTPMGVKKLLAITEMARQDMLDDGAETEITYDRFIDCVYQLRLHSRQ